MGSRKGLLCNKSTFYDEGCTTRDVESCLDVISRGRRVKEATKLLQDFCCSKEVGPARALWQGLGERAIEKSTEKDLEQITCGSGSILTAMMEAFMEETVKLSTTDA